MGALGINKKWTAIFSKYDFYILIFVYSLVSFYLSDKKTFPDSIEYIEKALKQSLFSLEFWFTGRQPGLSLTIKMVGEGKSFLIFHCLLYLSAWIYFYRVFTQVFGPLRWIGLKPLFLLIFAQFFSWNFAILTESASVSLLLIIFTISIELLRKNKVNLFLLAPLFFISTILFVLLKDSNSLLLFGLASITSLFLFIQHKKLLSLFFIIPPLFLISFTMYSVNNSMDKNPMHRRWVFPMLNNYGKRLIPHKDWDAYAKKNGVPNADFLKKLSGKDASSTDPSFYTASELKDFRTWFLKEGKKAYFKYLIEHPSYFGYIILKGLGRIFVINSSYMYGSYRPFVRINFLFLFFYLLTLVFFASKSRKAPYQENISTNTRHGYSFGILIVIFSIVLSLLIIVMDSIEIPRHCLLPMLLITFALIYMYAIKYSVNESPVVAEKSQSEETG